MNNSINNSFLFVLLMSILSRSLSYSFCLSARINHGAIFGAQRKLSLTNQFRLKNTESDDNDGTQRTSVTGMIYEETSQDSKGHPIIQLYTKEGCTLCDKAKDVLLSVRETHPHSLEAVDITDPDKEDIFDMYKWDIPVLHINGLYWTKHRLTSDEAEKALTEAREGTFEVQKGQPNAAKMERKMAERKAKS